MSDTLVPDSRQREPASTPLPTGEWGRPPRLEPDETPAQRRGARFQFRRFFPPPPPPPPVAATSVPPFTRRRIRSIAVELAVAAAVIGSAALLGEGPPSRQGHTAPPPGWGSRALPVLTALVGDLTTLRSDSAAGAESTPAGTALTADTARLQRDVSDARALPAPPDAGLRPDWSTALLRLDAVVAASGRLEDLVGAPVAEREGAASSVQAAVDQAVESLLRLAASVR